LIIFHHLFETDPLATCPLIPPVERNARVVTEQLVLHLGMDERRGKPFSS